MADDEKRTPREFVRDMAMRGRSDKQIRAVCIVTRWENQRDEVEDWIKRRADRWRDMPLEEEEEPVQKARKVILLKKAQKN